MLEDLIFLLIQNEKMVHIVMWQMQILLFCIKMWFFCIPLGKVLSNIFLFIHLLSTNTRSNMQWQVKYKRNDLLVSSPSPDACVENEKWRSCSSVTENKASVRQKSWIIINALPHLVLWNKIQHLLLYLSQFLLSQINATDYSKLSSCLSLSF